jgi:protein tyrosine phosphatase
MFRLIHGLPDKLAFYVRSGQPKTMYDALSFAKQGEAYKYRIHEQCAAIGKRADISRSDDISEMKSQIYDLTQMMNNDKAVNRQSSIIPYVLTAMLQDM